MINLVKRALVQKPPHKYERGEIVIHISSLNKISCTLCFFSRVQSDGRKMLLTTSLPHNLVANCISADIGSVFPLEGNGEILQQLNNLGEYMYDYEIVEMSEDENGLPVFSGRMKNEDDVAKDIEWFNNFTKKLEG